MVDVIGPLGDLASGLRARASALREAGRGAEEAANSSGWTGHRAELVLEGIRGHRGALDGLAWEYEQLAHRADNLSGDFHHAVLLMHHIEGNLRSWLSNASPEQKATFAYQGRLPDSGSPEWKKVLAAARAVGAGL